MIWYQSGWEPGPPSSYLRLRKLNTLVLARGNWRWSKDLHKGSSEIMVRDFMFAKSNFEGRKDDAVEARIH